MQLSQLRIGATLTATAALAALGSPAWAVGDGPRAYQLVPNETNIVSVFGLALRGNQSADPGTVFEGGDIDLNLGLVQYTRAFELGGRQAAGIVVAPFGESAGSFQFGNFEVDGDASGLGDLIVGGVLTLVGPPPLTTEEFLAYDPELTVGVLAKLFLPTGEYDSDNAINLGANRVAFQLGLPTVYYVGDSLLDPQLTTFEILPAVTFYGANEDPFGGAGETTQDPLFTLETHVTRNLNQALWVSLDALYTYGGETSTDGVSNDNVQNSLALGGTFNINFSPATSLKLSYGGTVWGNDSGPDGQFFRAVFTQTF